MRVLWFTNIPLTALVEHWGSKASGTGWWMQALLEALRTNSGISGLGVVYVGTECSNDKVELGGVDYFSLPIPQWATLTGIGLQAAENRCFIEIQSIIKSFTPDIMHIHGTERFYGLLKTKIPTPVPLVISIQGIMSECARYAWGDKSLASLFPLLNAWEITRFFPTLRSRSGFSKRGDREVRILRSADGILGRTDWDHSYSKAVAQQVPYFHVDEMLRPEFHTSQWFIQGANPHRIYTTARLNFLKGMHIFLEAMALLKRNYPDLEVRIAGGVNPSPECQHMIRLIDKLGLKNNVSLLGWLPAEKIVEELLTARCYVNTSFIENSSNSIQEAMLMGCPCVAAYTGGNPSIIEHGTNGLLAPNGCAHMFADYVRRLFEDDDLCRTLGKNARAVGVTRNDPARIIEQLISAYKAVCSFNGSSG